MNNPKSTFVKPIYLEAVLAIARSLPRGTVNLVEVRHETHCPLLNGKGACNCNSDVRLVRT